MSKYEEKKHACFEYIREVSKAKSNPRVKLLKGGSYKIKGYYLENNNLNDIRGASVNLSYVEDTVIPQIIKDAFCEECIIYNGGGNIFCILPESADDDFALKLEQAAQEYLIGANTAYVMMDADLEDIENRYRETMGKLEQRLSERKKLKIALNAKPFSKFAERGYIPWGDHGDEMIPIKADAFTGEAICNLCKSKIAVYSMSDKNAGRTYKVCASCLHKHNIGINARNSKYVREYNSFNADYGLKAVRCNTLSDIDDENIAVVYGDGNNMGQIIQNFDKITDMMQFSDDVKLASNRAVFSAMRDLGITRFQVVGLGGDDVFVIVSGKIAMEFAISLIAKYNEEFRRTDEELKDNKNPYKSTMSVGVCIAKTNTPIRIMLQAAEDRLALAKELAKKDNAAGCDTGSIAYVILNDPSTAVGSEAANKFGLRTSMQPYNYNAAVQLMRMIRELAAKGNTSRIRNIYDAYCTADTNEEAELYFKYQNARSQKTLTLPEIDGYTLQNGIYERYGEKSFIWKDIIALWNFSETKEEYVSEESV